MVTSNCHVISIKWKFEIKLTFVPNLKLIGPRIKKILGRDPTNLPPLSLREYVWLKGLRLEGLRVKKARSSIIDLLHAAQSWYSTWLICTCVDLWSLAEMTANSENPKLLRGFYQGKEIGSEGSGVFRWRVTFTIFLSHFSKLNVVLWKENAIARCLSRKSRMR